MGLLLRSFAVSMLEPWFPIECARCGLVGASPCPSCRDLLTPAPVCPDIDGLDLACGLVTYDETTRPFVAELKFRGCWAAARSFTPALAMLIEDCVGEQRPGPILTWAPTSSDRARGRGFDQAEVLARLIADRTRRPLRRLLVRRGAARQTGRSRLERSAGIDFDPVGSVTGPVLVIDDVITTGATLSSAALTLREAGASAVIGITLAVTPRHRAL